MNDQELIEQLSQASEGLLWSSESDYPFETVCLKKVDDINAKLLELTGCNIDTKIEVREFDKFFSSATTERDWYEEEEMTQCKRYRALVDLLSTHLTDIRVYRVGEVEVNCYILGQTESGAIAGLSTISVET